MAELLSALTSYDEHPKAGEEMADVVIVLYRLATRLNVDLHARIDEKMQVNRKRTWRMDGTGHGYHVKETVRSQPADLRETGKEVTKIAEHPHLVARVAELEKYIRETRWDGGLVAAIARVAELEAALQEIRAFVEHEDGSSWIAARTIVALEPKKGNFTCAVSADTATEEPYDAPGTAIPGETTSAVRSEPSTSGRVPYAVDARPTAGGTNE